MPMSLDYCLFAYYLEHRTYTKTYLHKASPCGFSRLTSCGKMQELPKIVAFSFAERKTLEKIYTSLPLPEFPRIGFSQETEGHNNVYDNEDTKCQDEDCAFEGKHVKASLAPLYDLDREIRSRIAVNSSCQRLTHGRLGGELIFREGRHPRETVLCRGDLGC